MPGHTAHNQEAQLLDFVRVKNETVRSSPRSDQDRTRHDVRYCSAKVKGVIGIVGFSGSGKTTLICSLIHRLHGVRVAVIKRTHHQRPGFEGDKDTDRYLTAGAGQAILVTPLALHRFSSDGHSELPLSSIAQTAEKALESSDLVIIESAMYDGTWPRLLVHAGENPLPDPLPAELEAIATDQPIPALSLVERFDRNDIDGIARFVIRITA